jgi:chorismate synthase
MLIRNKDQDSSKYDNLKTLFRPGHADFTYYKKYGWRDHRGGGRSSGRETSARVAGGAVAKKALQERGITITAFTKRIGPVTISTFDAAVIEKNLVRAPDLKAAAAMEEHILACKEKGDSVGGIVGVEITNVPVGMGDPVFFKLDARLGGALLSLGATKGVAFGVGFAAGESHGSYNNDQMWDNAFLTNNAGGIIGGISTGEPITISLAIKPTPSISQKQRTVTYEGANTEIAIEGRHDPCIVPRVVPVVENMCALVLLDALLIQERLQR